MKDDLIVVSVLLATLGPPIVVFAIASIVHERRLQQARKLNLVRSRLQGSPVVAAEAAMVATRSVWSYIEGKLFQTKWWPVKDHETRTFLRTQINVRLSGPDRLRLILTGSMRVYVTTYTDVEVSEAESLSNVEVHPFKE